LILSREQTHKQNIKHTLRITQICRWSLYSRDCRRLE